MLAPHMLHALAEGLAGLADGLDVPIRVHEVEHQYCGRGWTVEMIADAEGDLDFLVMRVEG